MRRSLTLLLLLIVMLCLPLGHATADDDAVARASDEAARQAVENAALKKALAQMAADRQQLQAAFKELGERVNLLTNELMATRDRVMLLERKLAAAGAANTSSSPAQPTLEAPATGSHPAALVGSYNLDKEHLRKTMLGLAMQQVESVIEQIPEDSRVGVLEMLKTQIEAQADKFRIALQLASDGTFTVSGRTGSDVVDASGTWSVQGKTLILTTTVESGTTLFQPKRQRGTIAGEALMLVLEESPDFTVRMVRG